LIVTAGTDITISGAVEAGSADLDASVDIAVSGSLSAAAADLGGWGH